MTGLQAKPSSAIVAVHDLAEARHFYGDVLGLEPSDDATEGVLVYKTGATHLVVYPSESAGSSRANAVVWACGSDLEVITRALAAKGVIFERYELDGSTYEDGIHDADGFKMVWFKDPDGNILHLNSA
jgi:catechol 2,3-dioxygenase-like lactoylglutathione lyase family enzyme